MRQRLAEIYGTDSEMLAGQGARYDAALSCFARLYGSGPVAAYRAPGRVNLIGEHTDYSQGYVLPMALDRDVLLLARARVDVLVRLANAEPEFGTEHVALSRDIPTGPRGNWGNYARGAAQQLVRDHGITVGMDALVVGAEPYGIPRGAGLSSSSALTVATACALADLNGLGLTEPALAEACGQAEWYVGTRGGIMDQFVSVLSRRGQALFLDCRPRAADGSYVYRHMPLPEGYVVVVVESGVRHSNTGPLYNTRVAEVRAGVRLVQARYPGVRHLRDLEDLAWDAYEDLLPECITVAGLHQRGVALRDLLDAGIMPEGEDLQVRRRCRHVITENARVLEAVAALDAGDAGRFGALMAQAHASARDDFEISTPEIEVLVDLARSLPGVAGARLTGAGWGGSIVALVEQAHASTSAVAIQRGYSAALGRCAQVFICQPAPGAGRVLSLDVTRSV